MNEMHEKISAARDIIENCSSLTVLTGAGISAESGVPTFRGKEGLWRNFRSEDLATAEAFWNNPRLVWEWYDWRRSAVKDAKPNPGHFALAELESQMKKAAKVGFDWPTQCGVLVKIREEVQELEAAVDEQDLAAVDEELGDLLFSVVNLARFRKLDPEVVLAAANDKFERRFDEMERRLKKQGMTLQEATPHQMDEAWEAAKKKIRSETA